MKTEIELPKAWTPNGWSERRTELKTLPKRVRVLLSAEWARSVLPIYEKRHAGDDRPEKAIVAAENWAKVPNEQNRKKAADAAYASSASDAAYAAYASSAAYAASSAAASPAYAASSAAAAYAAAYADRKQKWVWIFAMYRHTRGPRIEFKDEWKTSTAIALAQGIYDNRAFDRMPILADALQDAGFDHLETILHLQNDRDEMGNSDWVLTNLLGIWENE